MYGGAWDGLIFVLTHHPEDATPADGVTFLTVARSIAQWTPVEIRLASARVLALARCHQG